MCWSTKAIDERKVCKSHSGNDFPAHSILPLFGSANLSNSLTNVVFPEPVTPTIPVVVPALNVKSRSSNVLSRPVYAKLTPCIEISELAISCLLGANSPCSISVGDVNTSNTLVDDAIAL